MITRLVVEIGETKRENGCNFRGREGWGERRKRKDKVMAFIQPPTTPNLEGVDLFPFGFVNDGNLRSFTVRILVFIFSICKVETIIKKINLGMRKDTVL